MNHITSIRYLIQHWQLFAMRDGYTLHNTVIDAELTEGGFYPAFIGAYGTRVVVEVDHPYPTPYYARLALRNVLWAAHVDGRISLQRHPLETDCPTQELAA